MRGVLARAFHELRTALAHAGGRSLDWPGPKRALGDPVAAPRVLEFFAHELLLRWFDDGVPETPGFVINNVEEVRIKGTGVYLSGLARPHEPQARCASQDV
ncbi:hypothetical protein [Comamonas sp. JC664]|uniref:hypothetical protein n=1 Tax=Comamonas sp. JC664 TaxID=2801917 RepID=UPI00174E27A7|nr:hypothetical protein [Comamonas sp. JC664]MBL0692602.1 hypothetical protein [Comamonas sp. JC664]